MNVGPKPCIIYYDKDSYVKDLTGHMCSNFDFTGVNIVEEFNQHLKKKKFDVIVINSGECDLYKKIKTEQYNALFFVVSDQANPKLRTELFLDGIDDFLYHPITPDELKAIITCRLQKSNRNNIFEWKNFKVDLHSISISYKGNDLSLTKFEFLILHELIKARGTEVSKACLSHRLWKDAVVSQKTLDTHVSNLRNKLDKYEVQISCTRGQGHYLDIV